jgi:hypothetical protein
MRYVIIAFIVLILVALTAAGIFMVRDRGRSRRTLHALALRVALSVGLFALLFIGWRMGWITPHGVF